MATQLTHELAERELTKREESCVNCGNPVSVVDRFRDYSTTRGPMVEHLVTACPACGQRDLLHLAAQAPVK